MRVEQRQKISWCSLGETLGSKKFSGKGVFGARERSCEVLSLCSGSELGNCDSCKRSLLMSSFG